MTATRPCARLSLALLLCCALGAGHAQPRPHQRRGRRCPRGPAQEGRAAPGAAARARDRPAAPAGAVGRLLGAGQPAGAGAAGRTRRLLCAAGAAPMSKTGCATTGCSNWASAATGPTSPRVPALSHERRPRGHLLRDADRAPRRRRQASRRRGFKSRALDAWLAQRDLDDGCHQLATALVEARVFTRRRCLAEGAQRQPRPTGRARPAPPPPGRRRRCRLRWRRRSTTRRCYLNAGATVGTRANSEITALALARMAANDPEVAAAQLRERWQQRLPKDLPAWAWAQVGRQRRTEAGARRRIAHYASAWSEAERGQRCTPNWSDEHAGLERARRACAAAPAPSAGARCSAPSTT